jgi:mRNA deadenylase 3'-5' endonuclease subunit Ccr4
LWWRFGDWRQRERAILATLEDVSADVIGLQEVCL